jgi:transposase
MFGWGPATKISGATDMRKGFEGLYALVRDRLKLEPLRGHVFLFSNAQRNRLKLIFWTVADCGCARREWKGGRFGWPAAEAGQTKIVLSHEEIAPLLAGIDLAGSRSRTWFRKIVGEDDDSQKLV